MRSRLACIALVFSACSASPAVWDEVDPLGEVIRVDSNETVLEAVDDQTIASRLREYRQIRDAVELPSPSAPALLHAPTEGADDAVELAAEREELDEATDAAALRSRMDAYLGLPPEARRVTAAGDLLADSPPGTRAFDPFEARGCPPEGSAKAAKAKKLNRLKNRARKPHAGDIDDEVTFETLRAPGDDRERWSTATAATIEVYCKSIKATGAETCNCGAKQVKLTDAHFDLTAGPGDQGEPVIAEVTPIWRLIHEEFGQEDWSSKALKKKYEGKRIRITGWLFFDDMHLHEASNTDPGDTVGKKNWRATCWEIHPITRIEILQ